MKRRRMSMGEKIAQGIILIIFMVYVVLLFKIVLFKYVSIPYLWSNGIVKDFRGFNINPIYSIRDLMRGYVGTSNFIKNIAGNIGIFIPFGLIVPLMFDCVRKRSVVFAGFILSVVFETVQYILALGITDIEDVIYNTLGAAIGIGMYAVISSLYRKEIAKKIAGIATLAVLGVGGILAIYYTSASIITDVKFEYVNKDILDGLELEAEDINGGVTKYEKGKITIEHAVYSDDSTDEYTTVEDTYNMTDDTRLYLEENQDIMQGNSLVKIISTYSELSHVQFRKELKSKDDRWVHLWLDGDNVKAIIVDKYIY